MSRAVPKVLLSVSVCVAMLCAIPSLAKQKSFQSTTISNIANDPDAYDRKKVTVSGKIVSLQVLRSFRGDLYVSMVLIDEDQVDSLPALTVLFWPSHALAMGDVVTIEGRYHVQWRFGGLEHDHFVDASKVVREGEVELPPASSSPRIQL
tara:strand:- start:12421 stop:12870 length:450 start_codon:yes stop_codon:yes gene_type:complete